MNWDAIGAIGEIVGAVAVVVSLGYLAAQIKKQTEESRLAATRELAIQAQQNTESIATDAEVAEIYLSAVRDYESLPEIERMRASALFYNTLKNHEQQFIHSKNQNLDTAYFRSITRVVTIFLKSPGVQQWWRTTADAFEDEFQEHVNELIDRSESFQRVSTFSPDNNQPPNKAIEADA